MTWLEQTLNLQPHYQWLIFGVLLAMAEMLVPGVYLFWIALAAGVTGLAVLIFPLPLVSQFLIFAVLAVASAMLGRQWYLRNVQAGDPLLNERAARLIGEVVTVVEPATDISGRAKVADGEWPARGPGIAAGARARVVAVEGGVLRLEPVG